MSVPTRHIIVLSYNPPKVDYVLRANVPNGQEAAYVHPSVILPGNTIFTPSIQSPTGNASDPDLSGLINGTIAQENGTVEIPINVGETANQFRNRVQQLLIAQQNSFQNRISASAPRLFFGAYYDGISWNASGA